MDEQVNKFHNLGGNTIGEHKKNFNVFRKSLQDDPTFNPGQFFANLRPKHQHRQEEIFRVKLLQTFNRHPELLEVLKSGDRILCRIALKDKNFLRSILHKFSGKEFVDELTPHVSYVTRVNLVNKFSYLITDERVGEDYYNAVYGRYGLKTASSLLVACCEDFVQRILDEYDVSLTDRELIVLHKRYPRLLVNYLKAHAKTEYSLKLSTYLAKHDLNEFHALTEFAKFNLGKRLRARYLKIHKELLIKDPNDFPITVTQRITCKNLSLEEMRRLLTNVLKNCRRWQFYRPIEYLKHYPRHLRGSLLFPAFKAANGHDLWEQPNQVEKDLLEILSIDDRLKFDFLENFPELLPLETAIQTLKNKINVTASIYERSELARKMLEACWINGNTSAELLDVLKYFHSRHKNDNKEVRENILRYLTQTFELEKLGAEYWNLIEEMVLLCEINNDYLYCKVDLLGKFLVYKMSNGLEYEKDLLKFYKEQGMYHRNLAEKVGKYEKTCLLHLPEMIPEIYDSEKERNSESRLKFLSDILDYNRRHPKDTICPFDYFDFWMILVEQYLDNKYMHAGQVVEMMKVRPENEAQKELQEKFWAKIEETGGDGFAPEIYLWLLHQRPWVLLKYPGPIIEYAQAWRSDFFYPASKTDFLGLTGALNEIAMKIIADPDSKVRIVKEAVTYLSYQSSNVLSEIATKYAPATDCKINVRDESTRILNIQNELIRSFKNTPLPSAHINTLLPFCNADYFQHSLEPLYFIMYHTAEDKIEAPIFQLLDRSVSVRKHTLHLTAALCRSQLKLQVFQQMAKSEKNVSVRKYIFGKIYKLFIQEKTLESFQLLRDNLHLISKDDSETLHELKSCAKVPRKFLNEYLQMVWDYFAAFQNGSEFELIGRFDLKNRSIATFWEQVVRNSLFNPKNKEEHATENFIAGFLLLDAENIDHRLDIVWGLIKTYLEDSSDVQKKTNTVYSLINRTCEVIQAVKPEQKHKLLIKKIHVKFAELNITTNRLTFELLLKFTTFWTESDNELKTIAAFVIAEFNHLVDKFGGDITQFYADFMNGTGVSCLFPYENRDVQMLNLIELILRTDGSPRIGLFCLLTLPNSENVKERMEGVLLLLKENPSPVLRVYLDKYLQDRV